MMENRLRSGDEEIAEFANITPERRDALNQSFASGEDLANPIAVHDFIHASTDPEEQKKRGEI